MNSPKSTVLDANTKAQDTFTAIPTPSTSTLEGAQNVDEQLRDLILPPSGIMSENKLLVNVGNTEEDLEAANALLSLGDTTDTLEEGDENALLMSIGSAKVPEEVAPQPLQLDQINIDNAIAGLILADSRMKIHQTSKTTKTHQMTKTTKVH